MILPSSPRPKRGVSLYSYSAEYGISKNLEDCFEDMQDMGAHGLEILANTHIDNYPEPSEAWLDNWFALLNKYEIVPVEYGHWVDSRLYEGRHLTSEEAYEQLATDIRLAHKLGFTVMRTKLGVIDRTNTPVENWREFIRMALPLAEDCNVRMCPEIHLPTALKSQMVDDFVDFIEQTGTKHFGINVDFGVFRNNWEGSAFRMPGYVPTDPEDIVPLLPYVYCCHAKFNNVSDDFVETTIPYDRVLQLMIENGWDGYLLSEYEGADKYDVGYNVSEQLRKHHIMMKRILGA